MNNEEPTFPDFRVVNFRSWLNAHRNHPKEIIIGYNEQDEGFRFIKCLQCNQVYFAGQIMSLSLD